MSFTGVRDLVPGPRRAVVVARVSRRARRWRRWVRSRCRRRKKSFPSFV